jgi:hypothetical protein
MKDIMQRLAELEATAPKVTKKKMLKEDSTTPPINVSNKVASLKDMFEALSENIAPGQKPLPVLDPQKKQAGMGFVTSDNPAVQNMLKNLDPKDVQIVQAPGQQPQAPAAGQPAPAGATGQPQAGQMQMKEKKLDELSRDLLDKASDAAWERGRKVDPSMKSDNRSFGSDSRTGPGKFWQNKADKFEKAATAAAKRDTAKYNYEKEREGMSPAQRRQYDALAEVDMDEGMLGKAALGLAGAAALAGGAHAASPGKTRIDPVNPHATVTQVNPTAATPVKINPVNKFGKVTRVDPTAATPVKINPVNKRSEPVRIDNLDNPRSKPVRIDPVNKRSIPVRVDLEEGPKVDRMVKHIEKSEKKLGKSKGEAEDIAWATANKRGMLDNKNKKKVKEGDIPSSSGVDTKGAGLGAGRSATTLEGKKPDFLDLDKDGNKKEPMKKAAADKKKKKVDESMNHRISAARLEGKSHGLRGHAHSGKRYEDLDEIKAYHEGYKEGLDECYGQGVYETAPAMPAATVGGMADAAMDEGNAFTAALAKTPKGGKFAVSGKTFTDRTGYDAKVNEYAFESLDQQLNALLNESEEVSEGLSVSISKGQQNSPDSVTITAQDQEAEHLLAFVKNAGLGLFGDDNADTHSSAMSVQPSHGAPDEVGAGGIDIGVVDGHDGMMGLMQKLSGIQSVGADDYADEEGDEEQLYGNHETADKKDCGCDGDCECSDYDQPSNEATCNECGMMEAQCGCSSDKEMVDEVESEDQMEFEVAEDNAPDSGEAESTADENAEASEDMALAKAGSKGGTYTVNEDGDEASEEGPESKEGEGDEGAETVSESFANLFRKLSFIAEESTEKEDDKAEKAGKKVAKDIEHDEGHKGKDDDKAEKAGKKVTKDIEYDDKKDKREKVDEWANQVGDGPGKGTDASFEQDIDFMTKVIAGGLNKPKSTGQTTIPVITGQDDRMIDSPKDWATLAGIKK